MFKDSIEFRQIVLTLVMVPLSSFSSSAFSHDGPDYISLANKAVPSVVNISTTFTIKNPFKTPDDFFRRFFQDLMPKNPGEIDKNGSALGRLPRLRVMSLGSGFIIDPSGIILTNNHVVSQASKVKIQFTEEINEKPTDGQVIGRDPDLDVALIQVKSPRKMIPISLGDSESAQVGEYVMAIGNPFGEGHTVTHGIISAKGRLDPSFPLGDFLQTDAPINPGNSGGPLVDLNGQVIGINTAIEANAEGIGFAIPINLVKQILPQLRATGTVERGYIGVNVVTLSPDVNEELNIPQDLEGSFVLQVTPKGPAAKAGIKPYDIITNLDGHSIHSARDLLSIVSTLKSGMNVPVNVIRNGKENHLWIQMGQKSSVTIAQEDDYNNG